MVYYVLKYYIFFKDINLIIYIILSILYLIILFIKNIKI